MTDTDLWHSTSCAAAEQIMVQGFNQSTSPGYSEFNDSDPYRWTAHTKVAGWSSLSRRTLPMDTRRGRRDDHCHSCRSVDDRQLPPKACLEAVARRQD